MRRMVLLLVVWGVVQVAAEAQSGKEIVGLWLERVANELVLQYGLDEGGGEMALEEIMERLERLLEHPLDINRATREELEQIPLLTEFQVESILAYRESGGPILSRTELGLLNGFDGESAGLVAPLLSFSSRGAVRRKGFSSTLLLKGWWKKEDGEYIGEPFYSQIKYKGVLDEKYQLGFTLEKDYGELSTGRGQIPLGDFFSFYIQGKDLHLTPKWKISNVVLGDYSIKMGQGLALWCSSLSFSDLSAQGLRKRGKTVTPYTSSDENRFFRGGAITLERKIGSFSSLEGSAFFSLKNRDARRSGEKYTSLPSDGLHNTESLLKTRKTMGELAYGGSVAARWRNGKVGLNWLGYGYNLHNGRKVQEYNKYQMYDGQWGNFSADLSLLLGKVKLFAEAAMDYGGGFAILAGIMARMGGWEWGAVARNYTRDYIAPYAGACSSTSSCSNQQGVTVVFQKELSGRVKLYGGAEYTHYPWLRYNVPVPSSVAKVWGKVEGGGGSSVWNLKLQETWSSFGNTHKIGANGSYSLQVAPWLRLRGKGAVVSQGLESMGAYVSADARITPAGGKLVAVLQGAWYNCREWGNRLYMYEQDLPSSFATRLMYGSGMCWYALLNWSVGRLFSLYLKVDNLPKVKLGLRMRFF